MSKCLLFCMTAFCLGTIFMAPPCEATIRGAGPGSPILRNRIFTFVHKNIQISNTTPPCAGFYHNNQIDAFAIVDNGNDDVVFLGMAFGLGAKDHQLTIHTDNNGNISRIYADLDDGSRAEVTTDENGDPVLKIIGREPGGGGGNGHGGYYPPH